MILLILLAPKAATRVATMRNAFTPQITLAPGATAPLIPAAEQLIQMIDGGETGGVKDAIPALIKSIINVNRAQLKQRLSSTPANPDSDGGRNLSLRKSLMQSLAQGSIAQSVDFATQQDALIEDMRSRHEWMWSYAFDKYAVNDAFGRAAYARGDLQEAAEYLLKQTEIPPANRADFAALVLIYG